MEPLNVTSTSGLYSKKIARMCVRRGSRWLDKVAPGWEFRINKDTLMMHSLDDCIWGQVFGSGEEQSTGWGLGSARLHDYDPDASPADYGSEVPDPSYGYDILEEVWLEELTRRGH